MLKCAAVYSALSVSNAASMAIQHFDLVYKTKVKEPVSCLSCGIFKMII